MCVCVCGRIVTYYCGHRTCKLLLTEVHLRHSMCVVYVCDFKLLCRIKYCEIGTWFAHSLIVQCTLLSSASLSVGCALCNALSLLLSPIPWFLFSKLVSLVSHKLQFQTNSATVSVLCWDELFVLSAKTTFVDWGFMGFSLSLSPIAYVVWYQQFYFSSLFALFLFSFVFSFGFQSQWIYSLRHRQCLRLVIVASGIKCLTVFVFCSSFSL